MQIKEIVDLLELDVLYDNNTLNNNIQHVHASDLISEVLASCDRGALWLTGLLNNQVVNTAEFFDLSGVIFVGGRRPSDEIVELAKENSVLILVTGLTMFEACGILYSKGLMSARR